MLDAIRERARAADGVLVAGVLSGTSGDGIDVAVGSFTRTDASNAVPLRLKRSVLFETVPFDSALGGRVRKVLDGEQLDLRGAALLSRDLGRAFGRAARDVARAHDLTLDLVGSHGQTVYHHDGVEESGAATLQLGDGDFVREEVACPVVCDFRQRDIAAGGEGAPLSALADPILFADAPRPLAILNLGGMANLTWLGEGERMLAFDTGPAGALLDGLARRVLDRPFDAGGESARTGRVDESRVRALLAHPFFEQEPPKSTGRDTFGESWIDAAFANGGAPADLLATGVEAIARSVANAADRWIPGSIERIAVCGGGVHNLALMDALQRHLGAPVGSTAELGIDPDAREGLVFATLALACVLGLPVTRPEATGAKAGRRLGKICP